MCSIFIKNWSLVKSPFTEKFRTSTSLSSSVNHLVFQCKLQINHVQHFNELNIIAIFDISLLFLQFFSKCRRFISLALHYLSEILFLCSYSWPMTRHTFSLTYPYNSSHIFMFSLPAFLKFFLFHPLCPIHTYFGIYL